MDLEVNYNTVVVFDLDDTLYNEVDFVRSAFREIAMTTDPVQWQELYAIMFSFFRRKKDVFAYLVKNFELDKDHLIQVYRNHKPDIYLRPYVKEVMEQIKQRNGVIGLITDGRSITQTNKIEELHIGSYFDFIHISEESGHEKTSAYNFERVSEKYPGFQLFYIGDNPAKDFYHPNQAGWATIGILDNGLHIHNQNICEQKKEYLPDNWIWNFKDLKIS
ncbi:HAD family hydrolase [Robertkochia flava]|uniref:HAD family hydrolase n=1 Tax=Robertkochia flava TaxID=3447986 RepID=UPI001CCC584A|nr:HAD family hydrolase [Robertkochia marina]